MIDPSHFEAGFLTRHVLSRLRQRAIPPEALSLALSYGLYLPLRNGYMGVFLGRRLLKTWPHRREIRVLEPLIRNGLLLILTPDLARVVTAYRCDRPVLLKRRRR